LMATLAVGIVGGDMPWALVVVGMFLGVALIMMRVRSPMLVAVGMYLPFETTFAIFVGGAIRSLGDWLARRRGFNEAQMARVDNAGVLVASGLIAGESVFGLVWAAVIALSYVHTPWLRSAAEWIKSKQFFEHPSYLAGIVVLLGLTVLLIRLPISSAGDPSEPAPPTAMM